MSALGKQPDRFGFVWPDGAWVDCTDSARLLRPGPGDSGSADGVQVRRAGHPHHHDHRAAAMSDDRLIGGPVWQRWQDPEYDELAYAEREAREQEFLEAQYQRGRKWACSRGPRITSGPSHAEEFGHGSEND